MAIKTFARIAVLCATALCAASPALADGKPIGAVDTAWKLLGRNHQVVVERFDDPKVKNAACYVSYAQTGGIKGSLGLAENPSRFSIACRATGALEVVKPISTRAEGEVVFEESASFLFKEMRVTRFFDRERNTLVYLVWSTKLIDGSPFNSVTAIPLPPDVSVPTMR
jgi:CreA protein